MAMVGKLQDFSDSLPGLRAARRAGRLVPFVGAGISRPRCRSWPGLRMRTWSYRFTEWMNVSESQSVWSGFIAILARKPLATF